MNIGVCAGGADGLGPLQDLRRGGRDPQLCGRGAAVALQPSDGRPQDRRAGGSARHSPVRALQRRPFADLAGPQVSRACRGDGGGGVARRSRGVGDRRAGPRRGQAVDRRDARLALADAAAGAVPARARPYPARDHHPSVSGQRAPPRGRCRAAAGRQRRGEPDRPQDRPPRHRLLRLARLRRAAASAGTARRMEGTQRHRLRRPRVERASGALERCDHAAGIGGDAVFVAGRHAGRGPRRPRDFGAVLLRRRRLSGSGPRRAAEARSASPISGCWRTRISSNSPRCAR